MREIHIPPPDRPARPRDPYVQADPLTMAWERVTRDACELATLHQQARIQPVPAFFSPSGRRKDRIWVPSWVIVPYQPKQRVYVDTPDGRAMGTTTTPEVMGLALLTDGSLYQFQVVRGQPMLTVALREAMPATPPPHELFAAAARRILDRG